MASVCRSLQCLISTLTQWAEVVSCLGLLVQSCCGEGGALQRNITGVWGSTCSVPATLGLPLLTVCVFSLSTLLRLQSALQEVGPELHALPRPKTLGFRFSGTPQRARISWACILCLPRPSSSDNQELDEHTLPGSSALFPPWSQPHFQVCQSGMPCVSSGELISGCNPPGRCQPSRISGNLWLETESLFAVW